MITVLDFKLSVDEDNRCPEGYGNENRGADQERADGLMGGCHAAQTGLILLRDSSEKDQLDYEKDA